VAGPAGSVLQPLRSTDTAHPQATVAVISDDVSTRVSPFTSIAGIATTPNAVFVTGVGPSQLYPGSAPAFPGGALLVFPAQCSGSGPCYSWAANLGDATTPTGIAVAADVVYVTATTPAGSRLFVFPTAGCGLGEADCQPLATLPVPGVPTGVSVAGGQVVVASKGDGTTAGALTAYGSP
jgi:hypothetical protein